MTLLQNKFYFSFSGVVTKSGYVLWMEMCVCFMRLKCVKMNIYLYEENWQLSDVSVYVCVVSKRTITDGSIFQFKWCFFIFFLFLFLLHYRHPEFYVGFLVLNCVNKRRRDPPSCCLISLRRDGTKNKTSEVVGFSVHSVHQQS